MDVSYTTKWALTIAGVVGCVCWCCSYTFIGQEAFMPSTDELLPVPRGLRATVDESPDSPCGSGMCGLDVTVVGTDGQSTGDVYQQVRRHLAHRGWKLDEHGQDCRPHIRLLDERELCVSVTQRDGAVHVRFEGWRND